MKTLLEFHSLSLFPFHLSLLFNSPSKIEYNRAVKDEKIEKSGTKNKLFSEKEKVEDELFLSRL